MEYKVIYQQGANPPIQYSYGKPTEACLHFERLCKEAAEWLALENRPTTVEIKMVNDGPSGRITERTVTITCSK